MVRRTFAAICFAMVISLVVTPGVFAQSPVQLSVFNPVQIVPETGSVEGISLGLVYTVNDDMTGYDFNFVVNKLTGDMKGWQAGLVNFVQGEMWGHQEGFYNQVDGDCLGWQAGMININSSLTHGLQTGAFNKTHELRGVQFGLLNMTDTMNGLQIGILNFNSSGDPFGFMPIVNWSF